MSSNLNITPQLALSAARVLKDFCGQQGDSCKKCPLNYRLANCIDKIPGEWELPEGDEPHEQTN